MYFRFLYTGCDVDFTHAYGKIHTPGAFDATVAGDITVDPFDYSKLRTCTYTVDNGMNFTLLSSAAVGLGTSDTLGLTGDVSPY